MNEVMINVTILSVFALLGAIILLFIIASDRLE